MAIQPPDRGWISWPVGTVSACRRRRDRVPWRSRNAAPGRRTMRNTPTWARLT